MRWHDLTKIDIDNGISKFLKRAHSKSNARDLWPLRHWLHLWQLRRTTTFIGTLEWRMTGTGNSCDVLKKNWCGLEKEYTCILADFDNSIKDRGVGWGVDCPTQLTLKLENAKKGEKGGESHQNKSFFWCGKSFRDLRSSFRELRRSLRSTISSKKEQLYPKHFVKYPCHHHWGQ